ncbi:MAG: aminotransferase class I/II-fold pyridoxal phosphate-dependent enzyme [Gemmatimonadaceae bacterium]
MTVGRLEDFALERYFARWEFAVKHQLSASDVEPLTLNALLGLADDDARARWNALTLGYTESTGLPALRQAIAAQYDMVGADQVVVTAGAEEGIFLAMHALLGPADAAIVVAPAYQSLHAVARSIGATVTMVPLRAEAGWRLDPEEIARAVTPRTRVIVVNFPHNPTGAHITATDQRRLLEIADGAGAVLFSDEVYRGLEHDPTERLPPAADLSDRAVSLGVMSKAFALAGLRIGWIATRNDAVRQGVARLKDYTSICASAPSEILSLIALRARDALLERSRAIVAANMRVAGDFMASHADAVEWVPARAGSTAFPRFLARDADRVSDDLARRESVLLIPGSVFGSDASHFRLGLGRRDFPVAIRALDRVLRS